MTANVNKKYHIHTFGCQMNVHDSGKMSGLLQGMGHQEAGCDADADIILFNTCTVREHAHHKAISEIGRVIQMKKKRPGLIVGVCGCVAQEEREHLFEIYPELDIVFGPDQIHRLPELLANILRASPEFFEGRVEKQNSCSRLRSNNKIFATELVDDPNEYNWKFLNEGSPVTSHQSPVTAFVTIIKGCNNNCSFCIVPYVRGREVSRPADDIIKEIKELVKGGVKEVTLLGQNVNSYDTLTPPFKKGGMGGISSFVQLLQKISSETDILRIRYMSPHPKDLGDDLIEEHAANPKLCRHMHLPLQAGSDSVLRAMKRSYNKKQFIERALKLRERAEGIDITTDVIVGFPGETERDYQDTLDVVHEVAFDGMYAFKYSPRPGTKAAELKDDVPLKEKEARLQRLLALNVETWREKTRGLIGTVQQVLVEGASKRGVIAPVRRSFGGSPKGEAIPRNKLNNGDCFASARNDDQPTHQLTGRTFANKIVNFAGNLNLVGHIVPVEIVGAGPNSLKGEVPRFAEWSSSL